MDFSKVPAWGWMLFCFVCMLGILITAVRESRQKRNTITRLQGLLNIAQPNDLSAFALQDGISGLLYADNTLHVVDLRDGGTVVQHLRLNQIALLKIYETKKDTIPFRLVTQHQSETRRLETNSIVSFSSLVNLISGCGARIEYIPEES